MRLDLVVAPVVLHVRVDVLGGAAQGELAQGQQVPAAEEVAHRLGRAVRHVDLSLGQALQQLLGREVDELHLVGGVEEAVGHRLAHLDPGDAMDEVVEALDVLDVERGVDVDARLQELVDVLPPLRVAPSGRVGVGQLVQQEQARLPRERGVEVELLELHPAVLDLPRRQPLEPFGKGGGLGAAVGLDPPDHDVDAFRAPGARGLEHGVGLADARRRAEEDLEPAARPRLGRGEAPGGRRDRGAGSSSRRHAGGRMRR